VLADNMIATLEPIRRKALELRADEPRVRAILAEGSERARVEARKTLGEVKARMGFLK
jgi:hypothetical protein